jgi:hypothetical protein
MSARQLQLLVLGARTRRMLRHTADPVERALALVIIARSVADHAAASAASSRASDTAELEGAERILTTTLEHLHRMRTTSHHLADQQRSTAGGAQTAAGSA